MTVRRLMSSIKRMELKELRAASHMNLAQLTDIKQHGSADVASVFTGHVHIYILVYRFNESPPPSSRAPPHWAWSCSRFLPVQGECVVLLGAWPRLGA